MFGRKNNPNPIKKVREWNTKIESRAMDVENRMKLNGKQPSQMEWEEYRKLVDAYKSMGEYMSKLGDRYTPYYKEYYSDYYAPNTKRMNFNPDND